MKKVFYLFSLLALSFAFASCSNDDHDNSVSTPDVQSRAQQLGFETVAEYEESVVTECELGNHENCDILDNGTHQACRYVEHSGTNHDGTHHNGLNHNHEGHNGNGSHNGSHDNGQHNGGGNHH